MGGWALAFDYLHFPKVGNVFFNSDKYAEIKAKYSCYYQFLEKKQRRHITHFSWWSLNIVLFLGRIMSGVWKRRKKMKTKEKEKTIDWKNHCPFVVNVSQTDNIWLNCSLFTITWTSWHDNVISSDYEIDHLHRTSHEHILEVWSLCLHVQLSLLMTMNIHWMILFCLFNWSMNLWYLFTVNIIWTTSLQLDDVWSFWNVSRTMNIHKMNFSKCCHWTINCNWCQWATSMKCISPSVICWTNQCHLWKSSEWIHFNSHKCSRHNFLWKSLPLLNNHQMHLFQLFILNWMWFPQLDWTSCKSICSNSSI